ncbi:ISL3 family transposase [Rummeliibacillus suwonensis]|uniref:ISL3 family transposase n=1 Tax=Rummeliibacillus suwonensis TaxID=1306154 RepID=UPI00289D5F0F|nr:ISL3 family transposase [Rummeliibacillus suwonensis]
MNFNMELPGFKGVKIEEIIEQENRILLYISMPIKEHICPECGKNTTKIHDYRMRKIGHLPMWGRLTILMYKGRRYRCTCGKRFSEKAPCIERYQRFSKEANQAMILQSVKAKTFKEAAITLGTSISTILRRFYKQTKVALPEGFRLPKAIAIDEYKADTDSGKYQLIIANAETHEPIDILPNRRLQTIKDYLQKYGQDVEVVVMDMNGSFKAAVYQALAKPIIVADRFHYCRYIHWALDDVRRKVQKEWHAYDRKKCKKMRFVLHKNSAKLTEEERWYLNYYLGLSPELKKAYELKEDYKHWFTQAKEEKDIQKIKNGLEAFYRKVEEATIPAFRKRIQTLKNWQVEILNSFVFNYSNGFLEGINNKSKVLKRNAYGFRKYEHFKAKILLGHMYRKIGLYVG